VDPQILLLWLFNTWGSKMQVTRRNLIAATGKLAGGLAVGAVATRAQSQSQARRKLKVIVTGGHPGDPECGCGGTIARYTDLEHEVVLLYLNRGQGYCGPADTKDCGAVRTAEAEKACKILKARAVFAGQYDGRAVVDNSHYDNVRKLLDTEKPDVVFVQWPVDVHRDHRALSSLVLDAWLQSDKKATFYYYGIAEDTMMFNASVFVDITEVEVRKRAACYAHASQDPGRWYPLQEQITRAHGLESGYADAEGFIRHWQSREDRLP
jgi:LmbE family N-acetylglucosaminyl deacetylase